MAVGGMKGTKITKMIYEVSFKCVGLETLYKREFESEYPTDFLSALAYFVQARLDLEEANQEVVDRKKLAANDRD